jgi:AcrR family transcriptional regulator
MSKKTVYQYYADKDELVTDVFTGIMESNKNRCTEGHELSENALHEVFLSFDWVQEMFANMNPAVLFEMEKYHPGCFKKFKEHQNGFMYHMLKSNIDRGMKEGLYRDDLDVDIMTRYRIHSILLAFDPEVFPGNRHNIIYIERQLLEVFLNGIATPKGHKLIQKYLNQRTKK